MHIADVDDAIRKAGWKKIPDFRNKNPRGSAGIVPKCHGRRPGVVGATPELQRQATNADNGRHNADLEALSGEDRSLFDVEFEIAGDSVCRPPGLEKAFSRKTDTGQAAIKGREALKRVLEIVFRQAACYRTTSERADMGAFFIGEIDGFQGNGRHIIDCLQCQKNLKGRQHT